MRKLVFGILILIFNISFSQTNTDIKNGYYLTYEDYLNGDIVEVESHKFSGLVALPGTVEIRTKFKGLNGKTITLKNQNFWGFVVNGGLYKNANDSGRPMYVYQISEYGIFYLKNYQGSTKFFGSEQEELEKYTILYKTVSQLLDGLHDSKYAYSCDLDSRVVTLNGYNYQVAATGKKVRSYKIVGMQTECNEQQTIDSYNDNLESLDKKEKNRTFKAFKATVSN